MSMRAEFKKFAFRGNVVDLAVGVIVGGAFGRIVSALVADAIMPLVALVMPSGAWRDSGWVLRRAALAKDDVVLRWGDLLGAVLDFVVVALVLFVLVTQVLRAAQARLLPDAAPAPTTRPCPQCLEEVPRAALRCRACTSPLVAATAGGPAS